jgi:hypothetical protein
VAAPRIVDVEQAFIGGEREPVGGDERVGDERHGAEIGRDAVHAGKLQVPLLGDDVVVRIGEKDRAVGLDHDIVGAIEATPLKTVGDHRETAIELAPRDAPRLVLAGEKAALEVAREPIGPVGRLEDHGHALPRRVLDAPVVVDVVEQQVAALLPPQRPLGRPERPAEPLRQVLDRLGRGDDLVQFRSELLDPFGRLR